MTAKPFLEPPEEAAPFFEAAERGELVVQRCAACGRHQFYPRKVCVHCGDADVEWVTVSGRGTVHTFTVIHQNRAPGWADEVPYVVAIVDLAEGTRITANVVNCDPADVRIGMDVRATFVRDGDVTIPRFEPVL